MKTINLEENVDMPILGLGTWQLRGEKASKVVLRALEMGYRHIDTAEHYFNHEDIARAIKTSKVPRRDLFITTKVWSSNLAYKDVLLDCNKSLKELDTDYLDLYLIHWPNPNILIDDTLKAMDKLKKDGKIKSIGVSNFSIEELREVFDTGVKVVNNQIEFHPSMMQNGLKNYCDKNGIVITAYSPLGQGDDLDIDIIEKMAGKYGRPRAQVILNWIIQKGMATVPKASSEDHLRENLESLEWELEQEDIEKIDKIS